MKKDTKGALVIISIVLGIFILTIYTTRNYDLSMTIKAMCMGIFPSQPPNAIPSFCYGYR